MSRAQLINMARHNIGHAKAGTIEQAPDIVKVPVQNYFDPDRWQLEMDRIFRRMPLVLAMTDELRNPGDYKAMEAVGMPVLLSRGEDGEVRAFVNMCRHRGSQVMLPGCGNAHRFTCPYHAWTYDQEGALVGVYAPKDFGDVDKGEHGLVPLPVAERAGMIWVIVNPQATLDIDTFLSGYDELLGHFHFEDWHLFEQRTIAGPNWKIAYDGYMDLYHLPILHKDTFGDQFPNQALYYAWGPHQRVSSPDPTLAGYEQLPESEWNEAHMLAGVWTIFPHVSVAGFDGGGRSVMVSQLFPGKTPQESVTVQNYLMEKAPDAEQAEAAEQMFKLLEYVVQEEDYATGLRQQKAIMTGAMSHVMFGRNEEGGQRFHRWLDTLLATDDEDLNALFAGGERYC
ncbi:MAG TPA: aromatic ring-hydroxylating dioxygenase subunit alpha [Pseudomonadales bacterium]|jgi:phenylpropionate dioxygenase-like ring-hydroxylating dioxygenase large terminal subunit